MKQENHNTTSKIDNNFLNINIDELIEKLGQYNDIDVIELANTGCIVNFMYTDEDNDILLNYF